MIVELPYLDIKNRPWTISLESQDGWYPDILGWHCRLLVLFADSRYSLYVGKEKVEDSEEETRLYLIEKAQHIADNYIPSEEPEIDISLWK